MQFPLQQEDKVTVQQRPSPECPVLSKGHKVFAESGHYPRARVKSIILGYSKLSSQIVPGRVWGGTEMQVFLPYPDGILYTNPDPEAGISAVLPYIVADLKEPRLLSKLCHI